MNAQKTKLVTEPLVRFKTEPHEQMQVAFVVFRRVPNRLSAFAGRLLGVAQLDGSAGILVQDVVDITEGLFKH